MAGDPLDVIGSMTVHAKRPRLWVQAGSTHPRTFQSCSHRWAHCHCSVSTRKPLMIRYDLTKQ